jgi:secretory phospholipase A2
LIALVFFLSLCPSNSNVIQFGLMISQTLNVSPLDSLKLFNGYGCFCGLGGSGKPIDFIDTCCQEHDECYAKLETINCSSLLVNYKFTQTNKIVCSDTNLTSCEYKTCECDKKAVECFAKHYSTYTRENLNRCTTKGQCGPGLFYSNESLNCRKCEYGFIKSTFDDGLCTPCPMETISNNERTECVSNYSKGKD